VVPATTQSNSTTDLLGNTTTNTYDANGNLLTVTTPAPNSSTAASMTGFTYDSKGQLTQITDPLNHVTKLAYTSAGLINTITDAQNNVTTYQYDTHGNRTAVTDALQNKTSFAYDAMDRLTTITYPDNNYRQLCLRHPGPSHDGHRPEWQGHHLHL
jgi:YD repeat-containing protein